jgi:DNA polymerase IV
MRRVIFLVDMNAFFISCETTRRPDLSGVPAAVAGDPAHRSGIILAANYEARRFGVRTTMVLHEARRLCPQLVLVPPDHDFYMLMSESVMNLLSRFSPLIQPNSIDEAWLDMTGCENLSGPPRHAAESIMAGIRDELGLWCSIGISENKYLAKMAAEMKKPMGITELWQEDVPSKMWPLPVGDLLGVGRKTAAKMNRLGIRTIGDLAGSDPVLLVRQFGKGGMDMKNHARGMDDEPVMAPRDDEMKSIGKSTTLVRDASSFDEVKPVLMLLAEEVAASVRRHGKKARVVQISIKYADFRSVSRQMSVSPTHSTDALIEAGLTLLGQNWDNERPVRLIGISVSGFGEEEGQISMFDLPADSGSSRQDSAVKEHSAAFQAAPGCNADAGMIRQQRKQALDTAVDALRSRFGDQSVQRAALVGHEKPKRHGGKDPG